MDPRSRPNMTDNDSDSGFTLNDEQIEQVKGGPTFYEEFDDDVIRLAENILPNAGGTNHASLRHRYAVVAEFLDIESSPSTIREGKRRGMGRLNNAVRTVADKKKLTTNRVWQACADPYTGKDKRGDFLEDLHEIESRLID